MIAIVDYNMGNLRSVEKALQAVGGRAKVTSSPEDIRNAGMVIFPGVGSFGAAMAELKRLKLVDPIKDSILQGKPFLGLCLGMQLLFERSEESPGVNGLGFLKGSVKKFKLKNKDLKVPHMGWNNIIYDSGAAAKSLFKGVPEKSYMYFVHSYYVKPESNNVVLTTTDYGMRFASGVASDNIIGLQFHPEKSQELGLRILRNFIRLKG